MDIANLSAGPNKDRVRWNFMGENIEYSCSEIQNAISNNEKEVVFVLCGNEHSKRKIIGLSADGKVRFEIAAPAGWTFSYLTNHPTAKTAVVCGSNESVDGWYDWHFSIDPDTGNLSRCCPAY